MDVTLHLSLLVCVALTSVASEQGMTSELLSYGDSTVMDCCERHLHVLPFAAVCIYEFLFNK